MGGGKKKKGKASIGDDDNDDGDSDGNNDDNGNNGIVDGEVEGRVTPAGVEKEIWVRKMETLSLLVSD